MGPICFSSNKKKNELIKIEENTNKKIKEIDNLPVEYKETIKFVEETKIKLNNYKSNDPKDVEAKFF